MLSYSNSESPTANSVQECIIWQQADKLTRMGDLVQEQQEEDQRAREEDTVHIMQAEEATQAADARAVWKATKRAKQRARELEGEVGDLPKKKKARVSPNDAGTSVVPTGEADEGVELPEAPCKQCVC